MRWFYAAAGQPQGPVSEDEFQQLVRAGTVRPETLVWREGLAAWEAWGLIQARTAPPIDPSVTLESVASSGLPPTTDPSSAASTPAPETQSRSVVRCAECRQEFPPEDTVVFSGRHICPACKPRFLQRLQENAVLPPIESGFLTEAELLASDYQLNLAQYFQAGWAAYTREPAALTVACVLGLVIVSAFSLLSVIPVVGNLLSSGLEMIFAGPLFGGMYVLTMRVLRRENADVSLVFSGFGPRFRQLMIASLIPQLINFVGLLPLMIPGMMAGTSVFQPGAPVDPRWLNTWAPITLVWVPIGLVILAYTTCSWMYAVPLVADRNYRGWDALRLSWKMVHRHWFTNFALLLSWAIVSAVGLALCGIGIFVTGAIAFTAVNAAYLELFGRLEPRPTAN